jgi:hypothetical protein
VVPQSCAIEVAPDLRNRKEQAGGILPERESKGAIIAGCQ